MKQTRHIEVSVERQELSVLRRAYRTVPLLCPVCGREVPMFTVEAAASLMGTTPRAVYRRMEEGKLHFIESTSGLVLICSESCRPKPREPDLNQA